MKIDKLINCILSKLKDPCFNYFSVLQKKPILSRSFSKAKYIYFAFTKDFFFFYHNGRFFGLFKENGSNFKNF